MTKIINVCFYHYTYIPKYTFYIIILYILYIRNLSGNNIMQLSPSIENMKSLITL